MAQKVFLPTRKPVGRPQNIFTPLFRGILPEKKIFHPKYRRNSSENKRNGHENEDTVKLTLEISIEKLLQTYYIYTKEF